MHESNTCKEIYIIMIKWHLNNMHIMMPIILSHLPGLLARNPIATPPPEGIPTVFLSTSSTMFNFAGSLFGSK